MKQSRAISFTSGSETRYPQAGRLLIPGPRVDACMADHPI